MPIPNVSITLGGVPAPRCNRCGGSYRAEWTKQRSIEAGFCSTNCASIFHEDHSPPKHVPLAFETNQRESKCEKCAAPIFWRGGVWWANPGDAPENAVCHATPEQKANPLMLKDVLANPKLLEPKPCDHRAGVILNGVEARCAGCHLLVGTAIQNGVTAITSPAQPAADGFFVYHGEGLDSLYDKGAEMLRHAQQVADKELAKLLWSAPDDYVYHDEVLPVGATPQSELAKSVARRLLTPRDPAPTPPPEYGVDMSPFIKTPSFGEALKGALTKILPPSLPLDEAMVGMGYVPKAESVRIARSMAQEWQRIASERGDELQIAKDEKRDVEAENSRLRRRVEQLERRKP